MSRAPTSQKLQLHCYRSTKGRPIIVAAVNAVPVSTRHAYSRTGGSQVLWRQIRSSACGTDGVNAVLSRRCMAIASGAIVSDDRMRIPPAATTDSLGGTDTTGVMPNAQCETDVVGSLPVAHDTRAHEAIQPGGLLLLEQQPRTPTKCAPAPRGSPAISPPRPPVVDDEMADSEFHKALAVLQETRPRMGDSESASCWGGASLFVANDDDVMDEDSETDEFITASENGVEDEDSEEDEFAK